MNENPTIRSGKTIEDLRNLFDLSGKTAIVTGGSGALGRAVSLGLAAHGVDVTLCGIEKDALERVAREVGALGRRALPLYCDVTDAESVENVVKHTVDEYGKIDILFNGAGIAHRGPLVDMGIEDWQRVMDVNVKGTLIPCRTVAREMIRQGTGGKIILVGSVRGFQAHKDGYTAYGTSKAAVHYLTKQLAFEWAQYRIRVNCIAPCVFWSPLTAPILSDPSSYKGYVARIPIGRAAEPEDFIGPTVFLASDASEMVTGHVLSVDGGAAAG
jgi:NAD(P)-dependent dehydrogenase (short-subunit alcohol dehydrogenase family)